MSEHDITGLLRAHRQGDASAGEELFATVYDELCTIAHRQLSRRRPGQTLDTSALVHETYLKLADPTRREYADRNHFFAVAATVMRNVIVDYARQRRAAKRGGGRIHVDLDHAPVGTEQQLDLVLAVDRGLEKLSDVDGRMARVVECRYFAGLSEVETAEALGVSRATVQRDWLKARAWLKDELAAG